MGKSLSPPKYQPLLNEDFQFPTSLRSRVIPTTSAATAHQVVGVSKINPDIKREINETPRSSTVQSKRFVPTKSKFLVTPVDPLHSNKS